MKTFLIHTVISFVVAYQFFQRTDWLSYHARSAGGIFMLAFAVLWITTLLYNRAYFRKMPKAIFFILYILKEIFVANLRIAYDILKPRYAINPAVLAVPLDAKDDLSITLLACVVALTPGSIALDVRQDRRVLYVHMLYIDDDLDKAKHQIKHGFERRILELTT
ncbi:Na+/H+ antiporter subunit E [Pontibacter beigongshangensis]|uniref:Na+/H+ antiporter subunit E n=1 Tax=Pontibacter beigongshangensis TaxID=2574733 RepID=UPI00165016EF|nr:Na+/H+ antiporter subunit E [Pontibacter beigongshangensis]